MSIAESGLSEGGYIMIAYRWSGPCIFPCQQRFHAGSCLAWDAPNCISQLVRPGCGLDMIIVSTSEPRAIV